MEKGNSYTRKFDLLLTKEYQPSKTHSVVFTYSSQTIVASEVVLTSFKCRTEGAYIRCKNCLFRVLVLALYARGSDQSLELKLPIALACISRRWSYIKCLQVCFQLASTYNHIVRNDRMATQDHD